MAAKAWALQQKPVEEIFFHNDAVSLCLLVNRRSRLMRVIDFRAGPSSAKRLFVQSLAVREGVERVYTLVERDEVQTWIKLGFAKEGNIPGFYKRSDAFILGTTIRKGAAASTAPEAASPDDVPMQSEIRLTAAEPIHGATALSPGHLQMERTIAAAKREVRDVVEKALPSAKVTLIDEGDARKAVAHALRQGRAISAFEAFGRDVERTHFVVHARGGFELFASTETQACFGNAYLELLTSPKTSAERTGCFAALRALCEKLTADGIVSCFALAPSDDVPLAGAFLHNGFRRTGLLSGHLVVGASRRDAILWSRKLANPTDE
jgi:hypothetical protein